ncbi:AIG2-like protein [Ganoderma leucocontextum]|nr:AIG2-like protein [Ganoderma leucocontextum]
MAAPSRSLEHTCSRNTLRNTSIAPLCPQTLWALRFLAWPLLGTPRGQTTRPTCTRPRIRPVQLRQYCVGDRWGALLQSQRKKLDDFEGETYLAVPVDVETTRVWVTNTDMYLWNGHPDAVSAEEWDLEVLVRERLDGWL